MSAPSTETPEPDHGRSAERKPSARVRRGLSTMRGRRGSTAMVAGGTLLARAASLVRTNRRGAATRALVGLGLIAFGLRQRRSSSGREGSPLTLSNGSTAETGSGPDETASAAADGQARTDDTSTADGQPGADETAAERDRSSFAAEALDEEASVDAVTDPHDGEGDDDADGAT